MDHKIRQFVYRVRARLREQKIIENIIKFVVIGLLVAVILSFVSMMVPFYYAVPATAGIVGICFVAGIIMGIYKTPTPMEAALKADSKGHKEKISTAFYLEGKEDSFSTLQKKDALKVMEAFQVRKEFPLQLSWKQILAVLGLSLVFVACSMVETPAREAAEIRKDIEKEAKEEIARLEKVEKKLGQSREISETETAEIKEQIENAKRELSEAGSREELKKAQERITKKMEMAAEKTENKTLSETMQDAAKEAGDAAGKKESDLAKEAEEALAKAQKGNRKEKQDAYKKLKKLADAMGDEALKKAAEDYKDSSYSDSDYAGAQQALNEALENREADQTDLADNRSNTGSKDDQEKSSDNISQGNSQNNGGNQSDKGNQNNSQNGNANHNQNNGQNSGSGNGQGNAGRNGSGSGNGSGTGNGSGGGWNHGGKEGQEGARKTNENITVPDGETGDDGNLTGKANGNDSSTKEKSGQSQTWSGNKVSYGEVSGRYKEKAYKKVNGSSYPGKLKNKIRDYFDGLN
ncbi:MAG: hypothetical protein K2J90_00985 [Lachnospiraceae bacterium]|nr:hypothetical protein [Lachnospiraceae bacterium]